MKSFLILRVVPRVHQVVTLEFFLPLGHIGGGVELLVSLEGTAITLGVVGSVG